MNQFPYLYPHSLSEAERLNEEELWQDNRDAEVSHTQLTEMFRHSDPAALMDEAEQAQLAELDDTVTVYRGVTTINSDNLLALSWTLDYRNMHPLYPVQSKKNSPPPMKGTKRYRKEQKRAAKKARRQSIAHVLTLIENLDTQARVARSM